MDIDDRSPAVIFMWPGVHVVYWTEDGSERKQSMLKINLREMFPIDSLRSFQFPAIYLRYILRPSFKGYILFLKVSPRNYSQQRI